MFIFKKRIWKGIGAVFLSLILLLSLAVGAFWLTYIHIPTPRDIVHFNSADGVTLEGTLFYPSSQQEPFHAVLVLPGSGRITRDNGPTMVQSKAFVKKGFAVLVYDKRGTGESGGTFRYDDIKNLVADANGCSCSIMSSNLV